MKHSGGMLIGEGVHRLMAKCAAIKADGTLCQAQAMSSDDKCYTHSPKTAAARQRTNQRGGRTGGRGRPKVRVDEVYKLADKQIESLTDRSVDPKRSAVGAYQASSCGDRA